MITNQEIEQVMKEKNLPYSKAKMVVEMYHREAYINGTADYVYGHDEGMGPKGSNW